MILKVERSLLAGFRPSIRAVLWASSRPAHKYSWVVASSFPSMVFRSLYSGRQSSFFLSNTFTNLWCRSDTIDLQSVIMVFLASVASVTSAVGRLLTRNLARHHVLVDRSSFILGCCRSLLLLPSSCSLLLFGRIEVLLLCVLHYRCASHSTLFSRRPDCFRMCWISGSLMCVVRDWFPFIELSHHVDF